MVQRLFLYALAVLLAGYAFLGKGFAYLHFPLGPLPLYVGELVLAVGLLVVVSRPSLLKRSLRLRAVRYYGAFFFLGMILTLPYLGSFGIDAIRDAVLYYYGLFFVLVTAVVSTPRHVDRTVAVFARLAPVFLIWAPLATYLCTFHSEKLPVTPGTLVPLVFVKPGDAAIHVGAVLVFTLVMPGSWWLVRWPTTALALCIVASAPTMNSRAAALSIILAVGIAVLLTRTGRVLRLGAVVLVLVLIAVACGVSLTVPDRERELSVDGIWEGITSVVSGDSGGSSSSDFEDTKQWRMEWWRRIFDETLFGPYFLTGRGFGENLAEAHEIYRYEEEQGERPLRSPHNSHITVLSRMGVPGAILWVILNALIVRSLWRTRRMAGGAGDAFTEGLAVVLLCYWFMFTFVSGTDVLLEGPHGGIWFWVVAGFALSLEQVTAGRYRRDESVQNGEPAPNGAGVKQGRVSDDARALRTAEPPALEDRTSRGRAGC